MITELDLKQRIITEAREWIGTPWRHCQCVKGAGVDCVRFLHGVATNCGVQCEDIPSFYDKLAQEGSIAGYLARNFKEKNLDFDSIKDSDVLLFKFLGRDHHIGIATTLAGYRSVIHASATDQKVVEHILDAAWKRILIGVFEI